MFETYVSIIIIHSDDRIQTTYEIIIIIIIVSFKFSADTSTVRKKQLRYSLLYLYR